MRDSAPRQLLIGRLVLSLGLGIAAVLVASGGEESASAADEECLGAWNEDAEAVAFGLHQFVSHGYTRVQVLRVSEDGRPLLAAPEGLCAVAFASSSLDSEYGAAVRVLEGGSWQGLELLPSVTPSQLAEMQREAQAEANASLEEDGQLAPL